jgi:hypothetical protein
MRPVETGQDDGNRDDEAPQPPARRSSWQRALEEEGGEAEAEASEVYVEDAEHDDG